MIQELDALLKTGKIAKEAYDVYLLYVLDERGQRVLGNMKERLVRSEVIAPDPTMIAIDYGRRLHYIEIQHTIDFVNQHLEILRNGSNDNDF